MSDLTTAQRAPILVDGSALPSGNSVTSSDSAVVTPANVTTPEGSKVYAVANAPGTAVITVTVGGRSGTLAVSVTEAPLTITLGAPEPK